jgi:uncharacterized tellurite resistance protein B-like protein
MAIADGNVAPKELEQLYKIGSDYYGVSPEEIQEVVFSTDITLYKPETKEEKIILLYDLALIAWADGGIDEGEKELLEKFAVRFDVSYNQIKTLVEFLLENAKQNVSHEELLKKLSK